MNEQLKDAAYDPRNKNPREDFEYGWGAHSIQYVIDCLPEFQRILLKHYKRIDELDLLDVGAGSGAGSNLFTRLFSSHYVYSKINVEAVDFIPARRRWVKAMYPRVNYRVADLYELEDKTWDIVFCSAVVEHVPNPKEFCEQLVRVCKGFAFVYVPYNEINPIPSHINTFTEKFFDDFNVIATNIIKSIAWHPGKPEDRMILATLDCR